MRRALRGTARRIGMLLALTAGCSVCVGGGGRDPDAELPFPLAEGTSWTYEVTHLTDLGRRGALVTASWIAGLEVAERLAVPEGLVALLTARAGGFRILHSDGADQAELRALAEDLPRRGEPRGFLARGRALYSLPAWGWDAGRKSLTPEFAGLLDRTWPRLVFPLEPGASWAERALGPGAAGSDRSSWVVKGREVLHLKALGEVETSVVECVSPGGVARVHFAEGIGIVCEEFAGCCSRSGERRELVAFSCPVPPGSTGDERHAWR